MNDTQPGWVRRLWAYMLKHRTDVILSLGSAVLGSVCLTVVPLIERQIVNEVILKHTSSLWPWLTALIALSAAGFGFAYLRRYRGGRVALRVQFDLRNAMHDHLQYMDFDNLDRMPTGQLVARANSDSTLVQGLLSFFPIMSGNILLMLFSLGVMVYLSPLLAVVSVIIAPSLLMVSYRMRRRVFPATWDGQQREGDVAQIVDEDVNGVRVVKAFGQEHRELERIAGAAQTLYGSRMRAVRIQARYQPLLEAVPTIGQVAILAFGGWLALHHQITLGTFLAFSTYVVQLVSPARQLAGVLTIGQQARAGIERIFQLLDMPAAIADAPDAVELSTLKGAITFNDVHLSYGDGPPVLRGIDLDIKAGERVAIVGPSGSGKSTVAMLVSRFYDPTQGTVQVDGHNLRQIRLRSLRSQIGVVFEDSFLFSDSVRANIAYGNPTATDALVEAAAHVAQAHEFITALPRGYDTVVGERGLTLSGGQRQRIALARAIVSDPRILILDDATSAIDSKVEEAIHEGLREVMAQRTTLLVAHRRSTLHLADRIIVLVDGRIVEQGSHEHLMAHSAVYRTLLSGLEEEKTKKVGDSIEALASMAAATQSNGTTASAWKGSESSANGGSAVMRSIGAPSIGPGLGGGRGGGGGGGWRLNLAPTPELLARVAALPPIRDTAQVDLPQESRHQRGFSLPRLLKEFRRPLLLGLVLVVIDALATLAGPILVKTGIDNGVHNGSVTVLFVASGIFLFITLLDLIDEMGETFVTGRAAERIMLSLRIRIFAQLQRLSLDYYEREMAGRIMTRMTTDVDQFESLIENGLLSALVSMVTFIGVGCALVVINVELGLCTLSIVIPLAIATAIFRRKAVRLYDQSRERIAIVNADFQESLSGVRVAQAFVHQPETMQRFHRLGREYLESRVAAQRLVATYFPFVQFLSGVADAIVLGVGAGLVASGHLTSGAVIAFILYIDLFLSPVQQLSQVFDSWQQTRVSVGRIAELMQLETLTPQAEAPIMPERLRGEIVMDNVRFSYPVVAGRPGLDGPAPAQRRGPKDPRLLVDEDAIPTKLPEALRGIDLHIRAGETVALVGETGAGKSTVMKLLARFYDPDQGSVAVDGNELASLDLLSFRRQLGYVPQEGFLFSGTLRDNIAYGRPDASDEDVERAARAVGAHDFIAELPGGYRHELSERGRSLSSGQRQLIALARAELVDPAILLLDEATSNLDLVTEARVAAAMQRVSHNRTTIVIAHRLQTAKVADRIVVLHHGQVAEMGSHEELRALKGRYASMWEAFELVERAPQLVHPKLPAAPVTAAEYGLAMPKFLHSADWQLGMTRHFLAGEAQARFTAARIDVIGTIGALAVESGCSVVVVSGDVFETNQVERQVVVRALEHMKATPSVRFYLLPGNHDPLDASSVFRSKTFLEKCPPNVVVLEDSTPVVDPSGIEIIGVPWVNKRPLRDLIAGAIDNLPSDGTLRIVVGHGAVDTLAPDPTNPALVSVSNLESKLSAGAMHYVALGDRHSTTDVGGSGRVWYSGAPEPTAYVEDDPGNVLIVDLTNESCLVEPRRVGTWTFVREEFDLAGPVDCQRVEEFLEALPDKARHIVKLSLVGQLSLADMARLEGTLTHAGDLLGALELWERRSDLVVLPDDTDLEGLGLSGFAAQGLDDLRQLGAGDDDEAQAARDAVGLLYRLASAGQ